MKNLLKYAMPALMALTMTLAAAGCASNRPPAVYAPPPPPRPFPPGATAMPPGGAFPTNIPPQSVPPLGSGFPMAPNQPASPVPSPVPPPPPPGAGQGFPVAPPSTSAIPPGEPLDRVGYRWEPYVPQQPPRYVPPQTAQPPVNAYSPPPVPRPNNDPLQGSTPPTQPYTPPPPPPPVPPLVPPGPSTSQSERPEVFLLPPRPDTDPKESAPKEGVKEAPKSSEPPPYDKEKDRYYPPEEKKETDKRPAPLPVGIFGYDKARDNIHTGQRPSIEGLDWLEKNGFKTVVFLHVPGDNTDTDRQQVEKRGMTFVPIEVDAKDLHKDSVERFLRLQAESKTDKIFVYDVDGSLAGAMWYLSFRLIDRDGDDAARVRSNALGRNEMNDSARDLWQEVRRYLEMK